MAEIIQTPADTAKNIVQGIKDKSSGKSTSGSQIPPTDTKDVKGTPAVVDPNAGKEKYVVNGQEKWLTPEQARSYVQKGLAFEPRMDEFARLQQETLALQRALINDPGSVLSNIAKQANLSMKEMVQRVLKGNASDEVKESVGQWYYENEVEPRRLSPEQLKAREDAKYRQEREAKDKEMSDAALRNENIQKVNQAMNVIKAQIAEAMKESGLPSNDTPLGAEMAFRVAKVMQLAQRERRAITPKEAIAYVKKQIKDVQASYYDSLDADKLVEELGTANAEKVKKYFLKLANGVNDGKSGAIAQPKARAPGERKIVTEDDFHDYLDNLKKQGK